MAAATALSTVSRRQLEQQVAGLAKSLARKDTQLKNEKAKGKERDAEKGSMAMSLAQTAEIGVTTGFFGLMNGRFNGAEVLSVPVDLTTGLALHLAGFATQDDFWSEAMHNVADGALASFITTQAIGVGKKWREHAAKQSLLPTNP